MSMKKLLAVLMATSMVVATMPFYAFADDEAEQEVAEVAVEQVEEQVEEQAEAAPEEAPAEVAEEATVVKAKENNEFYTCRVYIIDQNGNAINIDGEQPYENQVVAGEKFDAAAFYEGRIESAGYIIANAGQCVIESMEQDEEVTIECVKKATVTLKYIDKVTRKSIAKDTVYDTTVGENFNHIADADNKFEKDGLNVWICQNDTAAYVGRVDGNITITLEYDINPNAQFDVTVKYVDEAGDPLSNNVASDAVEPVTTKVNGGQNFSLKNPEVSGYHTDSEYATAERVVADQEIVVVYARNEYTVTVKFVDDKGEKIKEDYTEAVLFGDAFNYSSRVEIEHYTCQNPTEAVIARVAGNGTITLEYKKDTVVVTINFVDEDGNKLLDSEVHEIEYNGGFDMYTPEIEGYTPDAEFFTVSNVTADCDFDIVYTKIGSDDDDDDDDDDVIDDDDDDSDDVVKKSSKPATGDEAPLGMMFVLMAGAMGGLVAVRRRNH